MATIAAEHLRPSPAGELRTHEDAGQALVRDVSPRAAWENGPALSDVERRQYEFEGGGAAAERQARSRPGWLARLFR